MPTITPNTSSTVTVPAGLVLRGTGTGTATLGPGPRANQQIGLDADGWVIGPFEWGQVVYVTATGAVSYEIGDQATGSPPFTEAQAAALQTVALSNDTTAEAAAANTVLLQSALDDGGLVRVWTGNRPAYINSTLRIGSNTTLELVGNSEIAARGAIGSLLTTSAFVDAGATVTVAWSAGMTASVTWTAHGRAVGDFVWLNRADQGQFCGVFRVESITDANTFVIRLRRLPTTTATGTIIGRVAHQNIIVRGGRWNYNAAGGNTGTASALHAIVLAGVWNLQVENIEGLSTSKYLLCIGAVNRYRVDGVGGERLNSDVVKVYGPAFDGEVSRLNAGSTGDDFLSFQTREPSAFSVYDFCHGDVLNASVSQIGGSSNTGSVIVYLSPFGIADNITIDTVGASQTAAVPQCRVETIYTTGTSEAGTITLTGVASHDVQSLVTLGNGTGTTIIRNLVIVNPIFRSGSNQRRLIDLGGSNVTASVTIMGGYVSSYDNVINCQSNAGTISLSLNGTRIGGGWQAFRAGTAGVLNLDLNGVTFEAAPNNNTFSAAAGTGVINLRASGVTSPGAFVVSMGAGSFLRLSGPCAMSLDGAALDATVTNHAPGASFYNTNAAFGTGVGAYVRGSTAWTKVAA